MPQALLPICCSQCWDSTLSLDATSKFFHYTQEKCVLKEIRAQDYDAINAKLKLWKKVNNTIHEERYHIFLSKKVNNSWDLCVQTLGGTHRNLQQSSDLGKAKP